MKRSERADPDHDGARFREGVALFNRGEYWDAHESWESVWLASHGERKQFLQGLIQLAAMCYHVERGNSRGASRLRDAALKRLDRLPDAFGGMSLAELRAHARRVELDEPGNVRRLEIRLLAR